MLLECSVNWLPHVDIKVAVENPVESIDGAFRPPSLAAPHLVRGYLSGQRAIYNHLAEMVMKFLRMLSSFRIGVENGCPPELRILPA
jgi:hypothetical protein